MISSHDRPRIAWVTIQPTPYFMPLFLALHERADLDMHFLFASVEGEQPWMLAGHRKLITSASRGWRTTIRGRHFNLGVIRALFREPWDAVVIEGYMQPTMMAAILCCLLRRIPFIMRGDSQLVKHRKWYKLTFKKLFLYPVMRRCSAAMGNGISAKRHWESMGIPEDRTFILALTSHLDLFFREAPKAITQRAGLRRKLGIPEDATLGVFVGRLVPIKQLDLLLQGLARIPAGRQPHLLIVGEGPERSKLDEIVAKNALPVTFAGFCQNEDLPKYYSAADFFVLSSRTEAWGVVVAEAMVCGLPLILSDQVGAKCDFLQAGINGHAVSAGSIDGWREALQRCVDEAENLKAMGEQSRQIIREWTREQPTDQFCRAIDVALQHRGK